MHHDCMYHPQLLCTNCRSSSSAGTSTALTKHPHLPDCFEMEIISLADTNGKTWREPTACIQKPLQSRTTTAPRFLTRGRGISKGGPLGNPHCSPKSHRVCSRRRRLLLLPRGNVTVERHWIKGTSGLALSRNFLLSVSLHV